MGYVVYDTVTTRIIKTKGRGDTYATEAAAKAAVTRLAKEEFVGLAVAELGVYLESIQKMVVRTNLMSGKEYMESVNTPSYCSPSSESYWSA